MKVLYGCPREECSRQDFIAEGAGLCYHCDNSILAGSEATLLVTSNGDHYRMHRECADKNCALISEEVDWGGPVGDEI